MPKSIAVFGAGPGLGGAVARRYAHEGYDVVLVARRRRPLDSLAQDLVNAGASAHVITADLADTDAVPALADSRHLRRPRCALLRPTPRDGFVAAADLTPQRAHDFMPLAVFSLLALVQQFLPHMLKQGDGAILTAQGPAQCGAYPT
jgi:short-subunit dehydrogenase